MLKRFFVFTALFLSAVVWADDTDMYFTNPVTIPTRVMLLLDTSGSMNDDLAGCDTGERNDCDTSKIDLARNTLVTLLTGPDQWDDTTEIGLSRYFSNYAGKVLSPIRALGSVYEAGGVTQAHRLHLVDILNALGADGNTPILSSYFEVSQYILGNESVFFDEAYPAADGVFSNDNIYNGVGTFQCRNKASIVVLTDGLSNRESLSRDTAWEDKKLYQAIEDIVDDEVNGYVCPSGLTTRTNPPMSNENAEAFWGCTNSLASALRNNHQIVTHVIAYNLDDTSGMQDWAVTHGGGMFKTAQNALELSQAFSDVIGFEEMTEDSYTAIVPGVSVNATNRFSYLDEIYFSVFKPSDKKFWYGNLKKYKLSDFLNGSLVDNAGYFVLKDDWSITPHDDGSDAYLGGAASRVSDTYTSRKLYVKVENSPGLELLNSGSPDTCGAPAADGNPSDICIFREHFFRQYMGDAWSYDAWDPANDSDHSAYQDKVDAMIEWLRGADEHNELSTLQGSATPSTVRKLYGAPLHGAPVLVNYTAFNSSFVPLERSLQENIVFVSNNDGKLYAIDAETGAEKFAYMPSSIVSRASDGSISSLEAMYDASQFSAQQAGGEGGLIYGLDSSWAVWRQDVNDDGNITNAGSNDFVYLYGGMRRGGDDYIALDVTAAESGSTVSELFVIDGGATGTEVENMGQTWSVPTLGFIRYKNAAVPVMFVGGGYDTLYDTGTVSPPNVPKGAQIYMIAAHDVDQNGTTFTAGDIIWWASSESSATGEHVSIPALKHSVVSDIKTVDVNGDGYVDHLYFGDLGGQLHRFDINNYFDVNGVSVLGGASSASELVSSDIVAQLGIEANSTSAVVPGEEVSEDDRRFYEAPSIALMSDFSGGAKRRFVGIAIGSGWRANPNNDDVEDQAFFIKDTEPFGVTMSTLDYASLLELPIVDCEDVDVCPEPENAPTPAQVASAMGLRSALISDSEKVISSPVIFGGSIFLTSYYVRSDAEVKADLTEINKGLADDSKICAAIPGAAKLYGYTPGNSSFEVRETGLNQSAAGGLTMVLNPAYVPPQGDGDDSPTPVPKFPAIGGTHSFSGLPDVDFSNIRKTSWHRVD